MAKRKRYVTKAVYFVKKRGPKRRRVAFTIKLPKEGTESIRHRRLPPKGDLRYKRNVAQKNGSVEAATSAPRLVYLAILAVWILTNLTIWFGVLW